MIEKSEPTYLVEIFVAGDLAQAKQICRAYCYSVGLCVTVQPCDFIYTGGEEAGAKIGLTNYPRFPARPDELWSRADALARQLIEGLHQHSAMLRAPDRTLWLTRRDA